MWGTLACASMIRKLTEPYWVLSMVSIYGIFGDIDTTSYHPLPRQEHYICMQINSAEGALHFVIKSNTSRLIYVM